MDRKRGMSFFFLPHIALFPFSHHSITVSGGTNLSLKFWKTLFFYFFQGHRNVTWDVMGLHYLRSYKVIWKIFIPKSVTMVDLVIFLGPSLWQIWSGHYFSTANSQRITRIRRNTSFVSIFNNSEFISKPMATQHYIILIRSVITRNAFQNSVFLSSVLLMLLIKEKLFSNMMQIFYSKQKFTK